MGLGPPPPCGVGGVGVWWLVGVLGNVCACVLLQCFNGHVCRSFANNGNPCVQTPALYVENPNYAAGHPPVLLLYAEGPNYAARHPPVLLLYAEGRMQKYQVSRIIPVDTRIFGKYSQHRSQVGKFEAINCVHQVAIQVLLQNYCLSFNYELEPNWLHHLKDAAQFKLGQSTPLVWGCRWTIHIKEVTMNTIPI